MTTHTLRVRKEPTANPPSRERLADELRSCAASAADAVGPMVLVRRKRAMELGARTDAPTAQEPRRPARAPRVFRVASAVQDAEASGGRPKDVQLGTEETSAAPVADSRPATGPRRRRRASHSPVTIIRPSEDGDATIVGVPVSPDKRVSTSEAEEPGLRFGQARDDHRRYLELQREIETLQREAEALRKAEVAAAVGWIRRAIAKYRIDASELGL